MADDEITQHELDELASALQPLVGVQFPVLRLPRAVLKVFEPSQIGTLVGTTVDACLPELHKILPDNKALETIGLIKHEGILGEREGYPDYRHTSGKRVELKLLYVDPVDVSMKSPPTPREPSARLTQKVTIKNVDTKLDVLMLIAYQLRPLPDESDFFGPTVVDFGIFSMIECIRAHDHRLAKGGGIWFGDYETPCILSKIGKQKYKVADPLDTSSYGRKEQEGKDFNEDTNFGKLKRIPYKPLQLFLKHHGAIYSAKGNYPQAWKIRSDE